MVGKSPLSKASETRPTFIQSKKDWQFSMEPNAVIVVLVWSCKWTVFLNKTEREAIPLKTLKMCLMATYVGVLDTDQSWTLSKPLLMKVILETLKMLPKNATGTLLVHKMAFFIILYTPSSGKIETKVPLVLYQILFCKSHWQSPVQRVLRMVLSNFSHRFDGHFGSTWNIQLQIGLWQYWTR